MDINKLIKLAKSYDTVGLYHEADQIMMKLAQSDKAVYVAPTATITFYKKNPEEFINLIYPGKFNYSNDEKDKRYERFNRYSDRILSANNATNLRNLRDRIDSDTGQIGDDYYGKFTLLNFINQFLQKKPNFDRSKYQQYNYNFKVGEKEALSKNQIDVIAQKNDGTPTVSFGDEKSKSSEAPSKSEAAARETPKPGFVQGVTNVGDVFKAAGSNYAMDPNVSKTVIPDQERYNTLLAKIKSATTPDGLNELKSNLATYGLSITSEDGLYAIRTNTPESASSQAQPLAAPKNPVQMSHPVADVNVQEYNLNRQRKQETNQDASRSEWNGYIQGDSFLQSLESRLKDIHNQVNPNNKSAVFNDGMIATIESKKSEYKPLIDMYRARKEKTYQNVGDLGPAQMYGTR
jgi:uncharacterized protein YfkK (UPF0435 family)